MNQLTPRSIKVLHVIDSAGYGGGERYVADIIRHASSDVDHIVAIPSAGHFAAQLQSLGVGYVIIDMRRRFSFSSVFELCRLIRHFRVDLVHSHGYRANIYSRFAAVLAGKSHICTMHVSLYDYGDTGVWLRRFYIGIEMLTAVATHRYICISRAMQEDARRMNIGRQKMIHIPNGVDGRRFNPGVDASELKVDPGLIGRGPVIGTVGRMVPEKGQSYLVEALSLLKSRYPDLKCIFLGEGPLLKDLEEQAEQLSVSEMCVFAGVREDIERIYPLMDVFVLPSLREPFGLAILEAMASGVPVIATAAGGPLDFLRSGDNGILTAPCNSAALAEEIDGLLSNSKKRMRLAEAGLQTVKRCFTIEKMVSLIESEYRHLVSNITA